MQLAKRLTLTVPALMLMASCASTPLAVKPTLPPPSVLLLKPCHKPVVLPSEGLTVAGVEGFWLMDRAALQACAEAKAALQDYYEKRDRALSGSSNGKGR